MATKTKVDIYLRDNEGIAGIRCDLCLALVEDYSDSGTLCKKHIDNAEENYEMEFNKGKVKKRVS